MQLVTDCGGEVSSSNSSSCVSPSSVGPSEPARNGVKVDVKKKSTEPKTRCKSGCITCRIRRVKCDEAKPSCVRCTSTGRKCDGYQAPVQKRSKNSSSSHRRAKSSEVAIINVADFIPYSQDLYHPQPQYCLTPNSVQDGFLCPPPFLDTGIDFRGLEYFHHQTGGPVSGSFDSGFWSSLVLQASHEDPTIQHAVLALSSLQDCADLTGEMLPGSPHQHFALQQYKQAVAQMVQRLSTNVTAQPEITLISSLLFLFVELMQNGYSTTAIHLKNGLQIMSAVCGQFNEGTSEFPAFQVPLIRDNMNRLFSRIIIQSIYLGVPYARLHFVPILPEWDTTVPFSSLDQARESLEGHFLTVHPLLLAASNPAYDQRKLVAEQAHHSVQLQQWHSTFLSYIAHFRSTFTPMDTTSATLIQLHYICLNIILATALNPTDAALESFTPSFARIVSLSEGLINSGQALACAKSIVIASDPLTGIPTAVPNFSFDLGVVPALYFAASKCRSIPLRWRAISLLQTAPHREGIWGAAMAAGMAQKLIEGDEAELNLGSLGGVASMSNPVQPINHSMNINIPTINSHHNNHNGQNGHNSHSNKYNHHEPVNDYYPVMNYYSDISPPDSLSSGDISLQDIPQMNQVTDSYSVLRTNQQQQADIMRSMQMEKMAQQARSLKGSDRMKLGGKMEENMNW